uniref:Uncharacterized protein n=1 Tax=Cucumis melo TaxID=3656 RepID=A0A9I9CVG8_CUCME
MEEGCGNVRLGFTCDGEGWSKGKKKKMMMSSDYHAADGRLGEKEKFGGKKLN